MKKLFLLLAAISMISAADAMAKNSFKITGDVKGLPDSTVLRLTPMSFQRENPIAEAIVKDGKFSFEGTLDEPIGATITVKGLSGFKRFVLDNCDITMSGTVTKRDLGGGRFMYNLYQINVSGSPLDEQYQEIVVAPRMRIDSLMQVHRDKYADVFNQLGKLNMSGDKAAMDSIYKTDRYQALDKGEKECGKMLEEMIQNIIDNYSNSIMAPLAILSNFSFITTDQRDIFDKFSDEIKDSYHGKAIAKELYPVGRPGDKMQNFTIKDINGNEVTLHDLCKSKKVVLLDFWASWCKPCRAEIPNLKKIYEKHKNNGFEIFSISIDQSDKPWLKAVEKEGICWTNALDLPRNASNLYQVKAVPSMYILDSEGRLVAENLRGDVLAAKIDELIAK